MQDNLIFALDIGTRSVTGLILEKRDKNFSLIDYCVKEHHVRSMFDGQIHRVEDVAEIVNDVKETLEKTHGPLQRVSVAAAGRSLKTVTSSATLEINEKPITDHSMVQHLELSAVHAAQEKIASQQGESNYSNYYCVGYSVLNYKLDNEEIGSLIGQSGQTVSVEIISTFLPKVVVESLLTVLDHTNLEMNALTLEPIAAIQVLVPETIRRLNIALVDIGAGTSDIAITNFGTVVAYGMVSIAGDEITEAISDKYLLDFTVAEEAKRRIVSVGQSTVTDILGNELLITYEELAREIQASTEKLATAIAEEIKKLNGKEPRAVMLIGGGSQTPELATQLANKLQLDPSRVAIRDIDSISILEKTDNLPKGPDFVTPIGIAIAAMQNPIHYISVTVNGKTIHLFRLKQLTIGDCLIQAEIDISKLYGKPGLAKVITLNGSPLTIPGELGKAPTILLNNEIASVESIVDNGDEITIQKGIDGGQARITLEELLDHEPTIKIWFNDKPFELKTTYYVNNMMTNKDYIIQDNDEIMINTPKTVKDFFISVSTEKLPNEQEFEVFVNQEKISLGLVDTQILVNDHPVTLDYKLKQHDHLTVIPKKNPRVIDVLNLLDKEYYDQIEVTFNQQEVLVKQPKLLIKRGNKILDVDDRIYPNDHLSIEERILEPFIFQDVFRYVDIDLTNATGNFVLLKNNQPTAFHEPIYEGDELSIVWH